MEKAYIFIAFFRGKAFSRCSITDFDTATVRAYCPYSRFVILSVSIWRYLAFGASPFPGIIFPMQVPVDVPQFPLASFFAFYSYW
ncbi:MAG: hypothetical protein WCR02_03470 [Sphaerochaetaceae bacterium]